MKKQILLSVIFLLLTTGLVSAALCKSESGYYVECDDTAPFNFRYQGDPYKSRASEFLESRNYNSGNNNPYDYAPKPIFKGSYGNYRYEMYYNGDYSPRWFQSYGYGYGYGYPVFSGGYYGYSGYGAPFFGGGYYGYHMPFSSIFWW